MTCPVIQVLSSESKKADAAAKSSAVPTLPSGWRLSEASRLSSVESRAFANGVSVSEGARTFTLIF